jgi:MarR family transcriptional regulator for hemolysin
MSEVVERADRVIRTEWIEVAVPESARIFRRVYEAYFAALNLNLTQALLIGQLDIAKGQTLNQTELAKLVGLRKAAIGEALDTLVRRKVISRKIDPSDARARLISLTERGKSLAAVVDHAFGELSMTTRLNVSPEQRREVVAILSIMRENLEALEADLVNESALMIRSRAAALRKSDDVNEEELL